MDYKEKVELMRWHSQYSNLNGTDAKVLMLMTAEANYKTSEVIISLDEIANKINTSKVAVIKSITKLIEQEAMIIVEKNSGKRPSNYRVSDLERLNFIFIKEGKNPKFQKWEDLSESLFSDIFNKESEWDDETCKCKDCIKPENPEEDIEYCHHHKFTKRNFESSIGYRKYLLWLKDNPKPEYYINTIKGKVV